MPIKFVFFFCKSYWVYMCTPMSFTGSAPEPSDSNKKPGSFFELFLYFFSQTPCLGRFWILPDSFCAVSDFHSEKADSTMGCVDTPRGGEFLQCTAASRKSKRHKFWMQCSSAICNLIST